MAQIVKLEPGDVLVLSNLGRPPEQDPSSEQDPPHEHPYDWLAQLKEQLQLGGILLFDADVDLSVLPAGWTPDAVAGS